MCLMHSLSYYDGPINFLWRPGGLNVGRRVIERSKIWGCFFEEGAFDGGGRGEDEGGIK